MAKTTLLLLLALCASPLLAQRTESIRVDSAARNEWYFVRSAITRLPDSTLVVDEQRKFFRKKGDLRAYVRDFYQQDIVRDSLAVVAAAAQLDASRQRRKDILSQLRGGGGQGSPRNTEAAPPAVAPSTGKKKTTKQ